MSHSETSSRVVLATLLCALLGFAHVTTAAAADKTLQKADVPKAVLAVVEAKYPTAKLIRFARENDGHQTYYEISVDDGATHLELALSPDGKLVIEQTTISASDLPELVRHGFDASAYAKASVQRIGRVKDVRNPDTMTYEFVVLQAGKPVQLTFDENGKLANVE